MASKSVFVVGDGYVAQTYLSSLACRYGNTVNVVAGVPNPLTFVPMEGVSAIKADLWDKAALTRTLREGNFCRVFLVLPSHADRLQMGWNGLEAARTAGVLQLVLVSVSGTETQPTSLGDCCPSSEPGASRTLPAKPVVVSTKLGDPNTGVRIQRPNVLQGWLPMKVKLVQISLPNPDPASRCGKPASLHPKAQENCIEALQQAFLGPYDQKTLPPALQSNPGTSVIEMSRNLARRRELLMMERSNLAAGEAPIGHSKLSPRERTAGRAVAGAHLPAIAHMQTLFPILPVQNQISPQASHGVPTNSMVLSNLLRAVQEQRSAIQAAQKQHAAIQREHYGV